MASLKRYTELPYVLQMLATRKLTLVNPSSWDDKNDAHYLSVYRQRMGVKSVLALCMTTAEQTYHHWRTSTHGASGACVRFEDGHFRDWLLTQPSLVYRQVEYKSLRQVRASPPKLDDLPFTKREAYEHEQEFRLVYTSKATSQATRDFAFPTNIIHSVVLNPWLPNTTFVAVRDVLKSIVGFKDLTVLRATIIENSEWRAAAEAAV